MKRIKNYPNYSITSGGSVWSKKRNMFLKPYLRTDGRWAVSLSNSDKRKNFPVHRLVLETFVGPRPVGMECRHLDGNPLNNNLSNLKWGTHKENCQDTIAHGNSVYGKRNGRAKLTNKEVNMIRRLRAEGCLYKTLKCAFNVSYGCLHAVITRLTWKHI